MLPERTSPPSLTGAQVEGLLGAPSGHLHDTPYPILLLAMALSERTAVLELQRNQLQKKIVFDRGVPVDCRSNIATEMLGRFLVGQGKLSEQDCQRALNIAASRTLPLGEILIELGLLTSTQLYRALQQNLGRKLLEPFSWKDGTYTVSMDVPTIEAVLPVRVPQLLLTGILKVESQDAADEAASVAFGKYLAIAPDPLFGPEQVRLTREQQKVITAARTSTKFDDLLATSGIDVDELNRIVDALLLLGIIMVTKQPLPEQPRLAPENPFAADDDEEDEAEEGEELSQSSTAAATRPGMPLPHAAVHHVAPPETPTAAEAAEDLMTAYLAFRRKDSFELLGIGPHDSPAAITRAFLTTADRFLPSRFAERTSDGLRDKAEEVFLAAARAFAELTDPERHAALVKKVDTARRPPSAARQPSNLIDPEALCQSGRQLAAAGKLREALSSFEMAAECAVQNGTYAAEAAWCRYQLNDSPPQTALKLLRNAIRIDPGSGIAQLYAGRIHATLGDRPQAIGAFQRAAALMPGDPRAVEAMTSLT